MQTLILMLVMLGLTTGCAQINSVPAGSGASRVSTEYRKIADVTFTPSAWPKELKADIYQPKGEGPWPGVLLIYGGSWGSADHRWQMGLLARKLARRGFVVMNAEYRGLPEFRFPTPFDDMREALRWLRAHAADYHVKRAEIAAYGFSAGGHLAALLGTKPGPAEVRVQAVVAASAPTNLVLYPDGDILPHFLGGTIEENPAIYREASPITYVTADDPPFFLYHGTNDTTVSPGHSKSFKAALDRAGVRNELYWVKGRGHSTTLIFGGAAEDAAIDFLDRELRESARR